MTAKKTHRMTMGVAATSALALVGAALAQDGIETVASENTWVYQDFKEQPSGRVIGKILHTKIADGKAVAFSCDREGKLQAAISMDGEDFIQAISTPQPRRLAGVSYKIGNFNDRARWQRLVNYDVLLSSDVATDRKLYNAAVRGEEASVESKRHGLTTINFPPMDAEKFAAFKQACEL